MQLCILTLLMFSNLLNQQIDTITNKKPYEINGEKYWLGGYNQVYKNNSDSLIRIDKSIESRITISSYIFEHQDTIIKYGGYGFWSQRNFLYYFDLSTLEWEYYSTIDDKNIEGSFFGLQNQDKDRIIFYGGKKVNPYNKLVQIPSQEVIEYNFNDRKLKKIGSLKFDVQSKEVIYKSNDFNLVIDDKHLYKINSLKNQVIKVIKPKSLSFIVNISYKGLEDVFLIRKRNIKTNELIEISLDGEFLNYPIEVLELFESKSKNTFIIIISIIVVICLIFLFLKIRNLSRISLNDKFLTFKTRKIKLEKEDIRFIKLLIEKNEIKLVDIFNIYFKPELTYAHNTRITNDSIDRISIRLKTIFSLNHPPFKKLRSETDRRQKVIVKSREFEIITQKIVINSINLPKH